MASFRPRFQISSLFWPKDNLSNSLFKRSSLSSMISEENVRTFWFKSKRKPVEVGSGNCGLPAPAKIESLEPCKGCPSKCIERKPRRRFFCFRKEHPAEKPSNCVKSKPPEVKLTLWEEIFGPDPKRSWPDPCTCRIANRQRKKQRGEDPRLLDPRYEETDGDVFLYTQLVKQCRKCCLEPQPKSPPAFKLPKAVMFRMIGEGCNKKPFEEITGDQEVDKKVKKMPVSLEYRIPYEELRPPGRRRNTFSCKAGIRPEDVEKPTNEELDFVKAFPKVSHVHSQPSLRTMVNKLPENGAQNPSETEADALEDGSGRRCRIEQLKMLIKQKKYDSPYT
ncbi:uncharacterized protein LOC143361354 [Halictus rubicundus]|uniref:uncharacterized protein LOC143361354 n=1 Tax=Halictus rubicundus TaxID=77578 RepID=UPI004035E640